MIFLFALALLGGILIGIAYEREQHTLTVTLGDPLP